MVTTHMAAQTLKQAFDPFVNLELRVWENFAQLGDVKAFKKEAVLKAAHATEKYFNVLLTGSGGNLIWAKNNFVCIDIAFAKEFLLDYTSFAMQQPSPIEVCVFEDSTVFRISHHAFQQVFEAGNHGEKVTRLVVEASLLAKQQQQIDLMTKTARERYLDILRTHPGMARTPLKYLASYLGVTPQSLSRIRADKQAELPKGK